MTRGILATALLGRDSARTARFLGGAVGLFALVFGLTALVVLLGGPGSRLGGPAVQATLLALAFGLATAAAYRNDGFLVCVALVAAAVYGIYLARSLVGVGAIETGPGDAIVVALSVGLPVGFLAFLTGAVVYRARDLVG